MTLSDEVKAAHPSIWLADAPWSPVDIKGALKRAWKAQWVRPIVKHWLWLIVAVVMVVNYVTDIVLTLAFEQHPRWIVAMLWSVVALWLWNAWRAARDIFKLQGLTQFEKEKALLQTKLEAWNYVNVDIVKYCLAAGYLKVPPGENLDLDCPPMPEALFNLRIEL